MANIHKVLIMKVPVGKFLIARHANGMLSSRIEIKDILQKQLPPREFRSRKREIDEIVAPNKCVVYHKQLLDDPPLDEKIGAGLIHSFSRIDVCRPNILLFIRDYKKKPVIKANIYGYHQIVKTFFSSHLSTDLRFKAYEIFNKAIAVDERNGTNTFFATLQLSRLFSSDIRQYQKLIDRLWVDPEFDPGQYFDWLHFHVESRGTEGNFKSTEYYNDNRFIRTVKKLIDENGPLLSQKNIASFRRERAPFRKSA